MAGYSYFEDDRGLGIEIAFSSNGWFRYRDYDGKNICVYRYVLFYHPNRPISSSSETVPQSIHILQIDRPRINEKMQKRTIYRWYVDVFTASLQLGENGVLSVMNAIYTLRIIPIFIKPSSYRLLNKDLCSFQQIKIH